MNKNNVIFCYSATGNSLALAKQLSKGLDMQLKLIDIELIERGEQFDLDSCILVFPSYAYGVPKLVKRFILECSIKAKYMSALVTYGSHYLGTLSEAVKLFKTKKQQVHYINGAKSVENYVHIFGLMKDEKITKRQDSQDQKTQVIIKDIANKAVNKQRGFAPFSRSVSFLFRTFKPLLTKCYRVKKNCNGCGMCQRICPTRAITMIQKNQKTIPKFKARQCDHCQACLQLCPNKAISYLRVTPKSRRYIHRDVNVNELIKR